jgi:hypothetical protein
MLKMQSADDPDYLRKRANHLRHVVRGLLDPSAVKELERFIIELEVKADKLTDKLQLV